MKNYSIYNYLLYISICCCLIQCTEEQIYQSEYEIKPDLIGQTSKTTAINNDNPYDSIGVMHNEILTEYLDYSDNHTSIEDIGSEIQFLISNYYSGIEYYEANVINYHEIEEILLDPQGSFDFILENACLSDTAQNNFLDFINALMQINEEEFSSLYTFIVLYESEVQNNASISSEDKSIILRICSIIRHSIFLEKGRDDGDWDTSVGNIAAAIKGACNNGINAAEYALITGLSFRILEENN